MGWGRGGEGRKGRREKEVMLASEARDGEHRSAAVEAGKPRPKRHDIGLPDWSELCFTYEGEREECWGDYVGFPALGATGLDQHGNVLGAIEFGDLSTGDRPPFFGDGDEGKRSAGEGG